MDVDVRTLTADDWQLFREVRLQALADAPDAFGRTLAEASEESPEQWQAKTAGPGPIVVLLEGGTPVAMGGVFAPEHEPRAVVWGMWTAPEARGRGYGARLLRELVAWCHEQGPPEVLLHVTEGNDAARRLYLAHGFEPTGEWETLRPGSPLRIEELRLGAAEEL
ncbi:MAG: GNAT family N-acetyltransferase [Nocardioides sp.]|nr:GNAT family N-acetyltransferase [Nocardioides sp.]